MIGPGSPIDIVVGLQNDLAKMGFYKGPIDGAYNTATRDAVMAVQMTLGIPMTGVFDGATETAAKADTRDPATSRLLQYGRQFEVAAAAGGGLPDTLMGILKSPIAWVVGAGALYLMLRK